MWCTCRFEPTEGGTRLVHGEKFQGVLIPLVGGMPKNTEASFRLFNEQLAKRVAEQKNNRAATTLTTMNNCYFSNRCKKVSR